MKNGLFTLVCVLILSALIFFTASCGVVADRQEIASVPQPSASPSAQPSSTDRLAGNPATVRFVAEATQVPDLFSRGSYIDEQHAWVAAGFEVKRTTDGGRTWQLMRPSTEDESVFGRMGGIYVMPNFITPARGWLDGLRGLWQTEDGGSTWQQVFAEHTGRPHFADEQHGWIATYTERYQQRYVTEDGGRTWQPCGPRHSLNRQTPHSAFFLTPQLGWAITSHTDNERRTIYGVARTSDGGCSWRQTWTSNDSPDERFCEIYFLNEREGWLAGCYSSGNLYHTTDGGETWREVQTPNDSATAVHVYFSSSHNGWIITRATVTESADGVYRTTNGGRTWQQLTESEILSGFGANGGVNQIPMQWRAGRLFQMLYASRANQTSR